MLGSVALVAMLAVAGCSANQPSGRAPAPTRPAAALTSPTGWSTTPASPSTTAVGVRATERLTPRIPGIFRTGVNFCGDPFAVNATTLRGTIGLLDCPGVAGLQPTPTLTVTPGDQVLVSGLRRGASISSASGAVRLRHDRFVAVRPGRAVVIIHHHSCLPVGSSQRDRMSCALLAIVVR